MTRGLAEVFPFGTPVRTESRAVPKRRRAFILADLPSAIWVFWTPPGESFRLVRIANEPEPLWNGLGGFHLTRWMERVGFRPEWGEVEFAPTMRIYGGHAPHAGLWLDAEVLEPLDLQREETWRTYCLPGYRDRKRARPGPWVEKARERNERLGIPSGFVRGPLSEGELVRRTLVQQRRRLEAELDGVRPERVLTLGNAAFRVMRELLQVPRRTPERYPTSYARYGRPIEAKWHGRPLEWVPLLDPTSESRERPDNAHELWLEWAYAQPRREVRPVCPECGARRVEEVIFGSLRWDSPHLRRKRFHPGGCCVRSDAKWWHCPACEAEFEFGVDEELLEEEVDS